MKYEATGTILQIGETQTFPSGFTKREVVIDTGGEYSQQIKFEFSKDKCGILDGYEIGQGVKVSFNIRGNEHNGKYYVNLAAWKMSLDENAQGDDYPNY